MPFNSVFKDEMENFLALRHKTMTRASCRQSLRVLSGFDRHHAQLTREKIVTEEMIVAWIEKFAANLCKRTRSGQVSTLRKFLGCLRHHGHDVFMPDCPKYPNDFVPYIFSDDEVEKIFNAAGNLEPTKGRLSTYVSRYTFPMLLRLLHGCGLRVNEALTMRVHDANFETGTLLMRNSKNKKQRIVPMQEGLTSILRKYCTAMRFSPEDFLFPTDKPGKHLSSESARYLFIKTLQSAGVYIPPPTPRTRYQCLNCFRHLFAIKSFAQAERIGRDVHGSVPFLSVYLGHFDMDGTEKYLKFSGDMFHEHTEMFESYASSVFVEVAYEE